MENHITSARPRWFRISLAGLLVIVLAVAFMLSLASERRERRLLTEKVELLESQVQSLDRAVQQERTVAQRHKLLDVTDAPLHFHAE